MPPKSFCKQQNAILGKAVRGRTQANKFHLAFLNVACVRAVGELQTLRLLEELALPYAERWDIQADSGCPQHAWGSDFPSLPCN